MSTMASQIVGVSMVCLTVSSGADPRKNQSSASLVFVKEFIGDRWIPLPKGRWIPLPKCFHLMTSSWIEPSKYVSLIWSKLEYQRFRQMRFRMSSPHKSPCSCSYCVNSDGYVITSSTSNLRLITPFHYSSNFQISWVHPTGRISKLF